MNPSLKPCDGGPVRPGPSAAHDGKGRTGSRPVQIVCEGASLSGELAIPAGASGVVIFAHGSGSSLHSPRNQFVAGRIQSAGMATLLLDLLSPEEALRDAIDGHLRFDIDLLAARVVHAAQWIRAQPETRRLGLGFFGASTGAAAALAAAAELGQLVQAVVSRGGRPDLAGGALARVVSPTLLIVGGRDEFVLHLNEDASRRLRCRKRIEVLAGATHLFEEPGALEEVSSLAADWFRRLLKPVVE